MKGGRPRTTLRRTVESERKELGWSSWDEARTIGIDRTGKITLQPYGLQDPKRIGKIR